jgi:hypothetical protein
MNTQRHEFPEPVSIELEPDRPLKPGGSVSSRDPVDSEIRLHAIFNIRLKGVDDLITIQTVGEAYRFLLDNRHIEWLEHYGLHKRACAALTAASERAVLARAATDAIRALFKHAKLL